MYIWDALKDHVKWAKILWTITEPWSNREFLVETEKLPFPQNLRISSWSYDMEGHAKKCVERYCELANKTNQQLHKISTPCIDDHHNKEEEMKSVGELSQVCSQIVLKCLYLARIGRLDILWSVNKLARSITKWPKHVTNVWIDWFQIFITRVNTNNIVMWEILQNNADWDCFKTLTLREILRTQKSTSGGTLCVFGSQTFVPISWMCLQHYSAAKAAVDKEWENLGRILALDLTTVRSKKEVMDDSRTKGAKVHFASLMDRCHLKNAELETSTKNTKVELYSEVILQKTIRGVMQYSLNKGHQHHKSQQQDMDIISRLPGCDGQAADAVSASTQVKMEDAPKLLKIPKSECPDIWIRLPRHKWPKSWSSMEDPVVLLERNLYGHLWQDYHGKGNLRKSYWNMDGRKFQIIVKKDYSYLCMWMT